MPRKKKTAGPSRPAAPALYSPERYEERWRLSRYFNPTLETMRVLDRKRFKVLIDDYSLFRNNLFRGDYVIFEQTEDIFDGVLTAIETPTGVKVGYVKITCDARGACLKIWYAGTGYCAESFQPEEIVILGQAVGLEREGKEYRLKQTTDPTVKAPVFEVKEDEDED